MLLSIRSSDYYRVTFDSYRKAVRLAQNEARTHQAPRYVIPVEGGYRLLKEPPTDPVTDMTTINANGSFSVPPGLFHEYPF